MSEEQQAARKAAAKKAKKLRQKLNKQQAQHAATNSLIVDLRQSEGYVEHDFATAAATSTLENTQLHSPLQADTGSLDVASIFGSTTCGIAGSTARGSAQSAPGGTAGSTARGNRHLPALPVKTSRPELAAADLEASKQAELHSTDPDSSMDDVSFLQELFRCPITQVSLLNH